MPVVIIKAKPNWALPTDVDPKVDPLDPEGPYTDEQRLTYIIGTMLPAIVADAMNEAGTQLGALAAEEVLVDFQSMHTRAINAPDLWILVSPMWRDLFDELGKTTQLLDTISMDLNGRLDLRLSTVKPPKIDVEVDFMKGGGNSFNEQRQMVASW